jgi:hypothetical protein
MLAAIVPGSKSPISPSYIVVNWVYFLVWIAATHIPHPEEESIESLGKSHVRLVLLGGPVVDGEGPLHSSECTIKDWAWRLETFVEVDHAKWGDMGMRDVR